MRGHPLKGPLSREKLLHGKKDTLFFLAEVECGVSNSKVQSPFTVAVVSLDLVVSDFFTAPVTHQDLG
jgi:hypothetical protein